MKLSKESLKDRQAWLSRGFKLPEFDLNAIKENTLKNPKWLHFGAGNIFRCFPALAHQELLNGGSKDGIIVCESFDEEIIDKAYAPFDNLNITIAAKADGSLDKTVVGSIVEALKASTDRAALEKIFLSPGLQMISFTITEKGYQPISEKEFNETPETVKTLIGLVAALCYKRFQNGASPLALVSMDNCSHNGEKLYNAVYSYAEHWRGEGIVEQEFLDYLSDPKKVSFPITMIDKITPRPSERIQQLLADDSIETEIVCTSKNTYVSSFVNAESTQYLVIEDAFPNGRPPLDRAGIIFTDAETVDKVEKMKVCTCLNPLHSCLAIFGCLLSYTTIWEEMKDASLKKLIEKIGYDEGLPVVTDPGIIDPRDFIDKVINERFPNSFVPDAPQRIACDSSQKIPVRFGETLKAYVDKGLDVTKLEYIPLFIAGWLRYLLGVDDNGEAFELSPDPLNGKLTQMLSGIKLGDSDGFSEKLASILSDSSLFGIDLVKYHLSDKIEGYFTCLVAGKNAVRTVLDGLV